MAFGITVNGFVIKPLASILGEINAEQLSEIDPGLDQDPRDPIQQINQTHAAALAELWELAQGVYSAAYPDSANGDSLDNVASITGTTRDPNTKTLIEDVDVELTAGNSLPAGSVANVINQPNSRFLSLVTVGPGPGTFQVDFEAETAGASVVVAGQLSVITQPVTGWTSVLNPTAGLTGTETEDDDDLRIKRSAELSAQGATTVDAIRADLLREVTGVVDARVLENTTEALADGLPPKSIRCILRGGAAAAIAAQIFASKAAGIETAGSETEVVTDTMGITRDIHFDFAAELDFFADMIIEVNALVFDSANGPDAIKAAVAAYVNGPDTLGSDVLVDQVRCAVLSVPGTRKVSSLLLGFSASPTGTIDLPVASTQFASSDVANLSVVIV